MKYCKNLSLLLFSLILVFLLSSFSSENLLSKLKSLSYIIRLVENYYVDEVELDEILDGAIHGLLDELDPHSQYIPPKDSEFMKESIEGEFEGIGIEFAILDGYITVISPIPGTPSDRAGLIGGDKFIKINQESAYKITQEEVFDKLRGPKGSSVDITIQRVGTELPFNVTLVRDKIPIHSVLAAIVYNDSIGYIKINRFAKNTYTELKTSIDSLESAGMTNLILDFRNNGGGLMGQAIKIVDLFVNSNDTILFTKGRIKDSNETFYATKSYADKQMPVITIINRSSASASEIVSGALQDLDRGLVVGETSFGKGLVQRQFGLDDGSLVRITVAKYYTPSGRMIQRDFEGGIDEYYNNLMVNNREANDSLLAEKPVFKTKNGRNVYGGGGITPDIFSPLNIDLHEDNKFIFSSSKRYLFKYAQEMKNTIPKHDTFKEFYNDANNYLESLNNFLHWINRQADLKQSISKETLEIDWLFLKNRIIAELASIVWGKDYLYHVLLEQDSQFQDAIKNLNTARDIMK